MTLPINNSSRDSYHTRRDFEIGYLNQTWQKYQGSFTNWTARGMKPPILDMGAGIGLLTECFLRNGAECIGLEASVDGAVLGKQRVPSMEMVCSILRPGLHFPFREQYFNTILFNQCVTQFTRETTRFCIAESNRLLNPGGMLIVSTTTSYFDDVYRGHNITAFTPEELTHLFQSYGFSTHVDISPDGYGIPVGLTVIGTKQEEVRTTVMPCSQTDSEWSQQSAAAIHEQAKEAYQRFDYTRALEQIEYAAHTLKNPDARLTWGTFALQLGDFDEARQIVAPLLESPALQNESACISSRASFCQRRFFEAASVLETIESKNGLPENAEFIWRYASACYHSQQYAKAAKLYEHLRSFPTPYPIDGLLKKTGEKQQRYERVTPQSPIHVVLIGNTDPDMQLYWLAKAIRNQPGHRATVILEREAHSGLPYDYYFSRPDHQSAILEALRSCDFIHMLNFPRWMDKSLQPLLQPQRCLIQYDVTTPQAQWQQIKQLHEQSRILAVINRDVSVPLALTYPFFQNQWGIMVADTPVSQCSEVPARHHLLHITATTEDIRRGTAWIEEHGHTLVEEGTLDRFTCSRGASFDTDSELLDECSLVIHSLRDDCIGFWMNEAIRRRKPVFSALSTHGWMACGGLPVVATSARSFPQQVREVVASTDACQRLTAQCDQAAAALSSRALADQWLSLYHHCRKPGFFWEPGVLPAQSLPQQVRTDQ